MTHEFCPGYAQEPFLTLCGEYPDVDVYPVKDFRVEWGPVFHRGRLDGSARVLVLGQDPAAHEAIARRILVGEAGQRLQGFLAKLGIDHSYVMVNTFLYSVYGQGGGSRHRDDPAIAAYRQRWLDALLDGSKVEAIVTLGQLAAEAMDASDRHGLDYVAITHPTYPESASASGQTTKVKAMAAMLENWNSALPQLHKAIRHPDTKRSLVLYGDKLTPDDLAPIPEADVPAGTPPFMRALKAWAARTGATADAKRATITVTVPNGERPWVGS
jgi:uracil-DNA glycosylase